MLCCELGAAALTHNFSLGLDARSEQSREKISDLLQHRSRGERDANALKRVHCALLLCQHKNTHLYVHPKNSAAWNACSGSGGAEGCSHMCKRFSQKGFSYRKWTFFRTKQQIAPYTATSIFDISTKSHYLPNWNYSDLRFLFKLISLCD